MTEAVVGRDGKKVWPQCPDCGCRLKRISGYLWAHFMIEEKDVETDARGCKCISLHKLWEIVD